jgi:outer membrane protein assembly factor BamB
MRALVLGLVLAGCAPPRTAPPARPGSWRGALGGADRSAFASARIGSTAEIDWRKGFGRGVAEGLQVTEPLLIATTTSRTVVTINAESGMQYWSRGFSGPIAGTALRQDSVLYVATGDRENRVYAITLARGRRIWSSRRIGTFRVEPLLLDGRLIAVSEAGTAFALSTSDGSILWPTPLGAAPAVPPLPHEGAILVATVRDTLYRISAAEGRVTGRLALPGTASAPGLVRDGRLVLPVHPAGVLTVDLDRWQVRALAELPAVALAAPLPAEGGAALLLTRAGDVIRLDGDGEAVRTIARLGGAATGSFARLGDRLVAGRLDGALFLLDTEGATIWRQDFHDSITAPVAALEGVLFVPLLRGDIVRLVTR